LTENIAVSLGHIYCFFGNYSKATFLPPDVAAMQAVCASLKKCWKAAPKAIIIAATILNPTLQLKIFTFNFLPPYVLFQTLSDLHQRFFGTPIPPSMLKDYTLLMQNSTTSIYGGLPRIISMLGSSPIPFTVCLFLISIHTPLTVDCLSLDC